MNFVAFQPVGSVSVERYAKFEIGLSLDQNFSNPYNPEEVSVQAIFYAPDGSERYADGFWFKDFYRCLPCPDPTFDPQDPCHFKDDPDPYWLQPIQTPLPWRIRFAPDLTGSWSYKVVVSVNGERKLTSTEHYFTVINILNEPGIVSTHNHGKENNRNFYFSNGTVMIPMGVTCLATSTLLPYNRMQFTAATRLITQLGSSGANLMRIFMTPDDFAIEWSETGLGQYEQRQDRAFDLDSIFEAAEQKGVYIQLILGSQREFYTAKDPRGPQFDLLFWANNPYNQLVSVNDDFFTQENCKKMFQRKLRYIIARWGYSSHLFAYEFFNEISQYKKDNGHFDPPHIQAAVADWHKEMVRFAKKFDPRHMYTSSMVNIGSDGASGFFTMPEMDFVSDHYYAGQDYNHLHHVAFIHRAQAAYFRKPMIFGELGLGFKGVNWFGSSGFVPNTFLYNDVDWHNAMWVGALAGSGGPGAYWIGTTTQVNEAPPCWGGQHRYYKPLKKFLENESIFYERYIPVANRCAGSSVKDANQGCFPSWVFDGNNDHCKSINYEEFAPGGIHTSNDELIAVFALKSDDRVVGWMQNKTNFWYFMPHHCGPNPAPDPDMCKSYLDNMPIEPPGYVDPMAGKVSVTIENMMRGIYKVEFYGAYHGIDINEDQLPDDGGVIPALTLDSVYVTFGGDLTLHVPSMPALTKTVGSQSYLAPDYGFKITRLAENWSAVSHFVIRPNPFSNALFIETEFDEPYDVVIYDMLGRIVYQASNDFRRVEIKTAEWKPGAYFIKIISEKGTVETHKFIRQG